MCHRIERDADNIENKLGIGNKSKCSRSPAHQSVILFHLKAVDYKTYVTRYL